MKNSRKIYIIFIIFLSLLLGGCASTNVTGVWQKRDYTGQPLRSLLVVALTGDDAKKTLWENIMVDLLNQGGVAAIPTTRSFPGDPEVTREEILQYVREHDIEGVLVTRLIDTQKDEVYYPPSDRYGYGYEGRYAYYNRFDDYYPRVYDRVSTPGYTATYTTVLLETNLYLTANQELLWTMSSDTFDPKSMNQLVESVGKKILTELQKGKLIPQPN